ncbi:MAG TPA: hypothetical protein VG056_08815 [Pirellulales bacterium]|nr:hypothetical protein [Pirellulales bacterium]
MRKTTFFGLLSVAAICGAAVTFNSVLAQERADLQGLPTLRPPDRPTYVQRESVLDSGAGNVIYFGSGNAENRRGAELNAKIDEALHKYTAAKDDGQRDDAKKQLQSSLTELFDIRQKEREEEIKQIEDRVAHLRDTLKKRESMRQELIDHHLTTLIQDAEGLGWGTEGAREKRVIMNYSGTGGGATVPPAVPGQIYRIPNALSPLQR